MRNPWMSRVFMQKYSVNIISNSIPHPLMSRLAEAQRRRVSGSTFITADITGAGAETPTSAIATEDWQLGRGFPQGILSIEFVALSRLRGVRGVLYSPRVMDTQVDT